MIFTFLISIVFIAELIIAVTILLNLRRLDKAVQNFNLTISYIKPSLKEVCVLTRKISAQLVEFAQGFIKKQEDLILQNIARVLLGTLFFRRFKKSKVFKLIGKGLSLLEIVV